VSERRSVTRSIPLSCTEYILNDSRRDHYYSAMEYQKWVEASERTNAVLNERTSSFLGTIFRARPKSLMHKAFTWKLRPRTAFETSAVIVKDCFDCLGTEHCL
jgi:hypothetical protein